MTHMLNKLPNLVEQLLMNGKIANRDGSTHKLVALLIPTNNKYFEKHNYIRRE